MIPPHQLAAGQFYQIVDFFEFVTIIVAVAGSMTVAVAKTITQQLKDVTF